MATTQYSFPMSAFPNGKVASDRLTQEIQQSTIVTALDYINTSPTECDIFFKDALSTADKITLDDIVAHHSGEPLASSVLPVQIYTAEGKPSPQTVDGRAITLPNFFPDYVTLYHAGAGDDLTLGRGQGTPFNITSDAAGDTVLAFSFIDWVYIAGGQMRYTGAEIGDSISFDVMAPKTVVTPNGGNTGNCDLIDPGVGAAILIVPAVGNGAYDVDLTKAVPVPAQTTDQPRKYYGYWDWSAPDTGLGVISPGVAGASQYNLFAIDLDPMVRFANMVQMLGDASDNLTIPAVAPKTFLPQWTERIIVHNAGHAGLKVVFRVVVARVKTT